jgi:hypothetical protein
MSSYELHDGVDDLPYDAMMTPDVQADAWARSLSVGHELNNDDGFSK